MVYIAYVENHTLNMLSQLSSGTTVKPVLSSHSKEDQRLVFKTDYHLMHVKSIAECSLGAFCNTFDLHLATICLQDL